MWWLNDMRDDLSPLLSDHTEREKMSHLLKDFASTCNKHIHRSKIKSWNSWVYCRSWYTRLYENYFRPTEQKVLEEYLKAEPYLTIDPSMRLIQENQILKVNIDKYEGMFDRIEMLEKRMQEKLR